MMGNLSAILAAVHAHPLGRAWFAAMDAKEMAMRLADPETYYEVTDFVIDEVARVATLPRAAAQRIAEKLISLLTSERIKSFVPKDEDTVANVTILYTYLIALLVLVKTDERLKRP